MDTTSYKIKLNVWLYEAHNMMLNDLGKSQQLWRHIDVKVML